MSESKQPLVSEFNPPHGSLQTYVIGFVSSIVLTVAAFMVATTTGTSRSVALASIAALAVVQCGLQLVLFLHLGQEFKPRYKLLTFVATVVVLFIFVVGSIWIMDNLNYRMMFSPEQQQQYIQSQDGL